MEGPQTEAFPRVAWCFLFFFFFFEFLQDEAEQKAPSRSTFHDDIVGTTIWPAAYDGRAIITDSYRDHSSGLSLDENKAKFKAATDAGDHSRQMCWA